MIFLSVFSLASSICVNTTHLKHQTEREISTASLPFCSEHNLRTCCDSSAALSIYKRFYKSAMDPPIFNGYEGYSTQCLQYSHTALCSECDGDIGEGLKSGLCLEFCENWFKACMDDYFIANSKDIEFCNGNTLICFKLTEVVQNGLQLCQAFGFAVDTSDCFTGTPSAVLKGSVKVKKPSSSKDLFYTAAFIALLLSFPLVFYFKKKIQSKII